MDGTSSSRSFHRAIQWCWELCPRIPLKGELHDVLQIDGFNLRTGWLLLLTAWEERYRPSIVEFYRRVPTACRGSSIVQFNELGALMATMTATFTLYLSAGSLGPVCPVVLLRLWIASA